MLPKAHPFTDAQIDSVAEVLHMNRVSALLMLRRNLAAQKATDHAAALLDNQPCEHCGRIEMHPRHRGTGHTHIPGGDIPPHVAEVLAALDSWHVRPDDVIDVEHAAALLDNLPCELCGQIEQHPNHRGARHMHRPATTSQGRAYALIALVNTTGLVVPEYVFSTALMMASSADPDAIMSIDYLEAVIDGRRVGRSATTIGPEVGTRDLDHPAEPHSTRWSATECEVCGRRVHNRFDDQGGFVSAAHYA